MRGDHYLEQVVSFLISHSGSLPVILFIDDDRTQWVRSSFSIEYYKGLKKDLAAFPVIRNVYLS